MQIGIQPEYQDYNAKLTSKTVEIITTYYQDKSFFSFQKRKEMKESKQL